MPEHSEAAAWLLKTGRAAPDMTTLVRTLCAELNRQGFELTRCALQMQTLHPEVAWRVYFWRRREVLVPMTHARIIETQETLTDDGLVEAVALGHGAHTPAFRRSPQYYMVQNQIRRLHCPIAPDAAEFRFPILKDLHAAGATDYFAMLLDFAQADGSLASFVTRRPGGFSDEQLRALQELADPLALCVQVHAGHHLAETLLQTYVGRAAGQRVLAGHVRRGDVERIHAAIWFSDMRGFTQLSGSVDSAVFIGWLNDYFGAIARPIGEHGGEILKFIGDAVLAVFPVDEAHSHAEQCNRALAAARAANLALDDLNRRRAEQGLPPINHGVALHCGDVQYGNIGAERRLDFTVIGPAVNMTSRLEGLCGRLGRRLLVSAELHAHLDHPLADLGTYEFKGIEAPQRVYGDPTA